MGKSEDGNGGKGAEKAPKSSARRGLEKKGSHPV